MAILLAAGLSTGCGSEPARGIWDGGFGTGSCSSGMTGQFSNRPAMNTGSDKNDYSFKNFPPDLMAALMLRFFSLL